MGCIKKVSSIYDWLRFTGTGGAIPMVAAGTVGVGAAGRLLKSLVDLYRRPPTSTAAGIKQLPASVADIPVEVTPEEADELRRKGVEVKRIMPKLSEAVKTDAVGTDGGSNYFSQFKPSFTGGFIYGGLGALGLAGGWKLTDYIIDKLRKRSIKSDIEKTRARINAILNNEPAQSDLPLHAYMKAAEDLHFSFDGNCPINEGGIDKTAASFGGGGFSSVLDIVSSLPAMSGITLGVGTLLAAMRGYNKLSAGGSPYAKLRAMREVFGGRSPGVTSARLSPFSYQKLVEPEVAPIIEAVVPKTEVVEKIGPLSPAIQAARHAVYDVEKKPSVTVPKEKKKEEEEASAPVSVSDDMYY
jgi:hypothetical protein